MNISTQTAYAQTMQNFELLGIAMPSALGEALDAASKTAITMSPASPEDVVEAILAAQQEGRDPAADEAVRDALLRMQLVQHAYAISSAQQSIQDRKRRDALAQHAPALVELMRPVVEAADAALVTAREALGVTDLRLTDPSMVGSLPAAHLSAWALAREARSRVELVESVWALLAMATGLARVDYQDRALIVAEVEDLRSIGRVGRFDEGFITSDAAAAIDAGYPLTLATFDQLAQRQAAASAWARDDAESARKAHEEHRDRALFGSR